MMQHDAGGGGGGDGGDGDGADGDSSDGDRGDGGAGNCWLSHDWWWLLMLIAGRMFLAICQSAAVYVSHELSEVRRSLQMVDRILEPLLLQSK